jgi:6-phosphogluconolactonase
VSVQVEIVEDPARECAAMLLGPTLAGGHIVLAGGSTPRRAYRELVEAVRAVDGAPDGATFWFGDERCVAPDDERSNYRMAREALLEPLGVDGARVRRMPGELGPQEGAARYEQELREGGPPRFDVVLLGIGPDGHTLSLFPGTPAVQEREPLVTGVPEAGLEPFVARISFTFTALTLARRVVLLAEGEGKAQALARAFAPGARPDPAVPSSILPQVASELVVLVDGAAGRGLNP